MKVLKMDESLMKQRKRVMNMLYEARQVLNQNLPYIKVRIVDFTGEPNTLGKCFIDKDFITISKDMTNWSEEYLRHVVWHELGHAYFSAPHNEKCPLMCAILRKPASLKEARECLLKLSKKSKKNYLRNMDCHA